MPSRDIDTTVRVPKLPQTGNFAYGSIFYSQAGKLLSNTLYFELSGPPPSGFNPDTAAGAFFGQYKTELANCMSNAAELFGARLCVHGGAVAFAGVHVEGVAGTGSTPPLPDEVAVVVRRTSGVPGRQGRGRLYVRCVPQGFVTASRVNSTGAGVFATLITKLLTTFVDQTLTYTPAHFVRKPVPPAVLGSFTPITGMAMDGNVGTSRRSRPRF